MMLQPALLLVALMNMHDENLLGVALARDPAREFLLKQVILKCDRRGIISSDGWIANRGTGKQMVWDPFDLRTKPALLEDVRATAFSFGNTHASAYVADIEGNVYRWNPVSAKKELLFRRQSEQCNNVVRLCTSPKGDFLFAGCYNGRTQVLWDLAAKKEAISFEKWISAVAFSPKDKLIIISTDEGLAAFDTRTFDPIWTNPRRNKDPAIVMLDFSPDGACLIAGSVPLLGATIQFFAPLSGKALREPIVYKYKPVGTQTEAIVPYFPAAQISPNGLFLASSFDSKSTDIWEMATMRKGLLLTGYRDCSSIVFRSQHELITTGGENEVCLWDLSRTPSYNQYSEDIAKRKDAAWQGLMSLDPMYGVAATEHFLAHPKEFFASVADNQLIPSPPSPERLESLINDLDRPAFLAREKAKAELLGYGELIEQALEAALQRKLTPEARNRVKYVLASVRKMDGLGPHAHRQLRAVVILEKIGTAECATILESLAQGATDATVKSRARESALRLIKNNAAKGGSGR